MCTLPFACLIKPWNFLAAPLIAWLTETQELIGSLLTW
jgi:hypothetical protein